MKNKKVKQMIASITDGEFSHLWFSGKAEGQYCLRKYGVPMSGIKKLSYNKEEFRKLIS